MLFLNKLLTIVIGFQTENLFIALILVRTCNSLLYLVTNTITHSLGLPYALLFFDFLGPSLTLQSYLPSFSIIYLNGVVPKKKNFCRDWSAYLYQRAALGNTNTPKGTGTACIYSISNDNVVISNSVNQSSLLWRL